MMTAVQQGCLDKKKEKYIPRYFFYFFATVFDPQCTTRPGWVNASRLRENP